MIMFESFSYNLLGIIGAVLAIIIAYYKWSFTYWKRKGLPYLDPSIPFGNVRGYALQTKSFGSQFSIFYKQIKEMGVKHGGVYMYMRPFYVPVDQALIKNIMQKDFEHFVDRAFYNNEQSDPLRQHLFFRLGTKWKNLRVKLTPTFTSGKMRMMFETMADCTKGFKDILDQAKNTNSPIDAKNIMSRFTTDVISSCLLGLEGQSMKDPRSQLTEYGRKFFQQSVWDAFKTSMQFFIPHRILQCFKFKLTKNDVETFFRDLVKGIIRFREENDIIRKDFFHILMQLKNRGSLNEDNGTIGSNNDSLSIEGITAEVLLFFIAGFETSAITLHFALFELSQNQEIQHKLRQEIKSVLVKYDNQLTYDAMAEMKYMDCVIRETLRKYSPVTVLLRKCTKSYNIPGTSVRLDKGTSVAIPILGIHYDPDIYPDPNKFDPDRFNEENKNSRPPMAHLPFGEGPRACIGLRFGALQTKVGLSAVLRDYKVTLNKQTKLPLSMNKRIFITTTDSPILLNVTNIS